MNAIETRGLTKRFGDVTAVDGLDLAVREGELFALLGVNGAGKSTTIHMLTGLLPPSSGEAYILGRSVTGQPREARALTALSPQESAVAPRLTVRENLELMCGIYSLPGKRKRAEAAMDELSLGEVSSKYAGTLSGGYKRRLSIAMALIAGPRVLFLDEPTLGLDVISRRELWGTVLSLRGRVTVVLTTHYLEEAEALSDRVGIMANGRLRALGTAEDLSLSAGGKSFEEAFIDLAGGAI